MTVRNDWVAHLMCYPLKELRRRQDICNRQIKIAYSTCHSGPLLAKLQDMADSLIKAIYLKTESYNEPSKSNQ